MERHPGTLGPEFSYEFIEFWLVGDTGKTKKWEVVSIKGIHLGTIKWFSKWRQYCFFPQLGIVLNRTCMNDLIDFTNKQMELRRKKT